MAFDVELFHKNFDFEFKARVCNNIRIATNAFDDFWKKNSMFLDDAEELYGRLLTYSVNRQFKRAASLTAPSFLVSKKTLNTYKAKAIFLDTLDYVINVCRTESSTKLPCKAAYKLNLSSGNSEDNVQLQMFEREPDNGIICGLPKKYAIIGYRYDCGKLDHMNIMVPDSMYQSFIFNESLMNNINEYYNYIPVEIIEETVASLKEDITNEAKKQNII